MTQLSIPLALQQALAHHKAGRLAEAEQLYRQILSQQPAHADALHLLGVIAAQVGRNDAAVDLIRRAISLKPNAADAHNNLANALKELGRLDEAVTAYRQAIALKPDYADAFRNVGVALQRQGLLDDAIAAFRQAIVLHADSPDPSANLGSAVSETENPQSVPQDPRLRPALAAAYNDLGAALNDKGQTEEAIDACRKAIALNPRLAMAYNNMGNALRQRSLIDDAIAAYQQALAIDPGAPAILNNLANALLDTGEVGEAIERYRQLLSLASGKFKTEVHSNICYSLYFHPDYDDRSVLAECRRWDQLYAQPLKSTIPPHRNDYNENRRVKIGYVSPDFRGHVESFFVAPLLRAHDHHQFEIHCYASVRRPDEITDLMKKSADVWHDVLAQSDEQLVQQIRRDQIDILVDLTMHMAENRLLVFSRKPAPVQVTWLAYPGTTGLSTIDYRLTDPYLDPPGLNDDNYSEESIRLPHCFWCYDPLISNLATNPLPANSAGHITFGCLNNPCKLNPRVLTLWNRILNALPTSRLLLFVHQGSHRQKILDALAIDPQRVEFLPRQSRIQYLQTFHRIDLSLDTFPVNGHTTSLDSLWMGVPVITLVTSNILGRAGFCQLSNLKLPDLIAHTPDQYVQITTTLAADRPRLAHLRSTLRDRMQASPLMDARTFARDMESAYRDMWRRHCKSVAK